MKSITFQKWICVFIFVFLATGVWCGGPAVAATTIKGMAVIESMSGEVQVQKGGKGDWVAAKQGGLLQAGDKIKTGAKSTTVIKWGKDNVMKLTPFSSVTIDRLDKNPAAGAENSSVDMWSGKVYARAKKMNGPQSTFEVKTPTAIAGVRGTELGVGITADDATAVECLSGKVQVRGVAGGEVLLGEREKTMVKKGAAPEKPEQLKDDDIKGFTEFTQSVGAAPEAAGPAPAATGQDHAADHPTFHVTLLILAWVKGRTRSAPAPSWQGPSLLGPS